MIEITLSPPNGILFVCDSAIKNVEVPEYQTDRLASATKTCVSVGTRADVDGDTNICLASSREEVDKPPEYKVFEGTINAPSQKVRIITAESETILETSIKGPTAKVAIWSDDLRNPSKLLFVVE